MAMTKMNGAQSKTTASVEVDGLAAAACLFHGFSDPSRIAILQHLALGEHRVVDLTAHIGLAQSTVSKHLACLRDCGLVTARPEGRATVYSLNHAEALVRRGAALEKLKQDDEAIQCYDRAIKADSKMTLAYLYKGGVCNRLERYEEASKCYEQALKTEDESRAAAHVPFTSAAERVSASRL